MLRNLIADCSAQVFKQGKGWKTKMPIKVKFARSKASKIKVRVEHPFWQTYQIY